MTDRVMYDFLLYHNYTSMTGLIGSILGVLLLGVAITKGSSFLCHLHICVDVNADDIEGNGEKSGKKYTDVSGTLGI